MINPINRLTQLLLLAVTVLVYSVVAMAIANSLFVNHVGAGNLPFAFILIGLCSLPAYIIFSQIIDRYNRPRLFRYILLFSILIIAALRLTLNLDSQAVYYLLLIAVFFQWDFHNNILYPSLLTDYFTSLEYKQYAPYIGIAQAVGTMLGGGFTILLSHYLRTRDLLFSLPIFFALAFVQLLYLEKTQRRLDKLQPKNQVGILESLQTFPELVKRYPLVIFLASSSFLLVIIYISSEFLWFNIYGQNFAEEALTKFLGLMRIIISFVQVIVLYGLTRPLLKWLGVARMNSVYPVTTLAAFSGLLLNFNLLAGIGLHINGDALYKAINIPVHQLNYNGVPKEFIGRVRAMSDGVIYSLGLILAGSVLWLAHLYLTLEQITYFGVGLTLLLLLVRLPMGKFYAEGLEDLIRSNSINLDDFNSSATQLPPQSSNAIRELLTDSDRYIQRQGLELANNLDNPCQFLPEIEQLLLSEDDKIQAKVVDLFASSDTPEELEHFNHWLQPDRPDILRETALEVLITHDETFTAEELARLLKDSNAQICFLAAIAIIQNAHKFEQLSDRAWSQINHQVWQPTQMKAIIRLISHNQNNNQLVALLQKILPQANSQIKQEGLEVLTQIASINDLALASIAVEQIKHPEPFVRIAAFKLLAQTRCPEMLELLQNGFADSHARVRQQVAKTISAYGIPGLALAQESLFSPQKEVNQTAIAAIAQVRSRQANNILFQYLATDFELLNQTRKWQEQIPQSDPHWSLLALAIADYHQRLIQKVLYILACLGYSRTVNAVNRILATTDQIDLANAVELLVSLNHRRFVLPLVPLLEQMVKQEERVTQTVCDSQWLRNKGYQILLKALESKERWIRTGALVALTMVPSTLLADRDSVVPLIAQEIVPASCQFISPTTSSMNRLLLLKNVALFKNLTLDELYLIDQALEQQQILSNETIYTEGSWGEYFYIIAEGKVKIVKNLEQEEQEIKQLAQGEYFGEISLFDNAPRWDGAIALEDCTLLKLEKKRFLSLISQRPHIILEICRFLSMRLRETDKYLSTGKKVSTPNG